MLRSHEGNDPHVTAPASTYPAVLLAVLAIVFVALGIAPTYRQDWLLENVLVLTSVPLLIATHRRLRFSNLAYSLLFVFFVLHEIGAHYTYSLVPYDSWFASVTDATPTVRSAATRNHYDRVIHFAYGLLVTLSVVELLRSVAPPRGVWRWLLPVFFILANSGIYELIEWAAALVFGGELGTAYLGTQGDEWDSQKDMACAVGGALLAMLAISLAPRLSAAGAGPLRDARQLR